MSNSTFEFKQFKINQDLCAMKVGTDAVLLGSWVYPNGSQQILDIGTGTGVIALMLAQKTQAEIIAIDIDALSVQQAVQNFSDSKFHQQLHIEHIPLQEFARRADRKFSLIVTNPPYFQQSYKSTDEHRSNARHADSTLPFDDLLDGVVKLLDPRGKFCLILPKTEALLFRELAEKKGLYLSKLMRVKSRADKDTDKRHLMQFEFTPTEFSESVLVIEKGNRHDYTDEYKALTKDYYIHF